MAINYRGANPQDVSNTSVRLEPVVSYDYSAYDSSSGTGAVEVTDYWLVPDNFEYSSSVEIDKEGFGEYSASYFLVRPIHITGSFYGKFTGTSADISGSLNVNGSSSFNGPITITGSTIHSGYVRLDPTEDPGNSYTSSHFLFQSASNTNLANDLHFRQNGQVIKFNWLVDTLFTGLLYGGVVTYSGNTVYISSGSGIIVDHNANTINESAPSIQYITWPDLSFVPTFINVRQVTYIAIDSGSSVYQGYDPFTTNDYRDKVVLGAVGHFDLTNVTAFQGATLTAYDQQNQTNTFIDAFGPLKLTGYGLTAQPSSFKLSVAAGSSFIHGGFYDISPVEPSNIATAAQATASLAYVYRNGSGGIFFDTNGGAFYTNVTCSLYDDGTGTPASVSNNNWTIQRVAIDPRTGKLYIYYGQNIYPTLDDALANLPTDTFEEGDTKYFTTFLGYLVVKSNTSDLASTADNTILSSGLFRGIGGGGGGTGGGGAGTPGGSNTQVQYNDGGTFGGSSNFTFVSSSNTVYVTGSLIVSSSSTFRNIGPTEFTGSVSSQGGFTGSLQGTSSYATEAGNASTIDINVFGSPVDSYLLMSNVAGTAGVAIGGDADLRYNSSTNVLTVGNVSATTLTGSLLGTAATASYLNTLNQNLTFNGNLTLNGTASINYLNVQYETASVIYSSGSNQFGDAPNDVQSLYGTVQILTGSLSLSGSVFVSGSNYVRFNHTGSGTNTNYSDLSIFRYSTYDTPALKVARPDGIGFTLYRQGSANSFWIGDEAGNRNMTLYSSAMGAFTFAAPGSGGDFLFNGGDATSPAYASSIVFKTFDFATNAATSSDHSVKIQGPNVTGSNPYNLVSFQVGSTFTEKAAIRYDGGAYFSSSVGVGTSSALYKIDVLSNDQYAFRARSSNHSLYVGDGVYNTGYHYHFAQANTDQFVISMEGGATSTNFGIGLRSLNIVPLAYRSSYNYDTSSFGNGPALRVFSGASPATSDKNWIGQYFTSSVGYLQVGTGSLSINPTGGNVGINTSTPIHKLDVSGSGNFTNNLTVTGSLTVSGINGGIDTSQGVLTSATQNRVEWIGGILNSSTNGISIDWESRYLIDASGATTAVDWGNGVLNDSTNVTSIDWASRRLLDTIGSRSADYDVRFLIYPDGTTAALNYGTQNQVTLNANTIITGSSVVGMSSLGTTENTLTLGPPPAGGTGEGGQLGLQPAGGAYTSASFIDNWQNQFRILKGTSANSTAGLVYIDLHTNNTQFVGAVTASAYSGLPNDYLYATRSGSNQTVGSAWANTDVIFNNTVVSKGISYNTGTGLASLTGGKVYRITARLAWSAAAAYNLQFSCYTSANTQIGPTVEIVQSSNGTSNISDGTLEFIYAPGSNTDVKIRTTANNTALSGEAIRHDLNTQLIIQQIA